MKIKLRVIIMALLSLPSVIAGQSNCYPHDAAYLSGDMNIRSSYSAASRVVSTARAGDSFAVSQSRRGDRWCWLDIGRGWLANTTRVSPTPPALTSPAQASQPANVDNCCFVDRQCHSDQDWEDGYWAFSKGQCAAPAQSISAAPPNADNCCFIGWQCHNDYDWLRGYQAFQNNQCGGAAITNPGALNLPAIEGSAWFRQQIAEAFEFLRVNSPKWFNYTAPKIRRIVEVAELDSKYGGEQAYAKITLPDKIVQVRSGAIQPYSWPLHSALVHEACHAHQWDSGKYDNWAWSHSLEIEPECYETQAQALAETMPGDRRIRALRCFAASYPDTSVCGFS